MTDKSIDYSVVITTCANADDAKAIASVLLEAKLAACIQVMPITSYYTWKGARAEDPECLLLIKTRPDLFGQLEAALKAVHKYEVPEIVELPILDGHRPYLDWMSKETDNRPRR